MNIETLRKKLAAQFEAIENGSADFEKAKHINFTATNILQTAKVELQYSKYKDDKRVIKFLEPEKK